MHDSKHIVILQSAHYHNDDRVFYHQAKTLTERGHQVEIYDCVAFQQFQPTTADIYIVDTPRAMWKVKNTTAKIIYDITEWYPSKKNLRHLRWGKVCKAILLTLANLWAGIRADAFIFGETDKAAPFRFLFPQKPAIELSYYPSINYIPTSPARDISKQCHMLYAGPLTKEKGFHRTLEAATLVAQRMPEIQWHLTIISTTSYTPKSLPKNLQISTHNPLPFNEFCNQLPHYDLFLDLRDIDFENTRCLPIKLFYYMAAGRPSIFSHLRAINKGVPHIHQCAHLVHSAVEAADAIAEYVTLPQRYLTHCTRARQLATTQYNWENIHHRLIQLIDEL